MSAACSNESMTGTVGAKSGDRNRADARSSGPAFVFDKSRANTDRIIFLFVGGILITLGVFPLPDAVRIHHAVLVFPPHLIIAAIIGLTWNSQQRFQRTIALIAVALVCLGGRRSIAATSKVESRNPRTRALERKLEPVLPRKSKPIRFNNRQSGLGV